MSTDKSWWKGGEKRFFPSRRFSRSIYDLGGEGGGGRRGRTGASTEAFNDIQKTQGKTFWNKKNKKPSMRAFQKSSLDVSSRLISRTGGKRHPARSEATSVSAEAFFACREGPSTRSLAQRGHLKDHQKNRDEVGVLR